MCICRVHKASPHEPLSQAQADARGNPTQSPVAWVGGLGEEELKLFACGVQRVHVQR